MKGIILDGMVATGKTTILNLVNKKLASDYPNRSKIFLTEHYSQRMLEHLKEGDLLSAKYISKHTKEIIRNIETYQDMLSVSKFSQNPSNADMYVIIERFIFTLLASAKDTNFYLDADIVSDLLRLKRMNIKQIILKIPEDKLLSRIMDTLQYRNEFWKEYLSSIGNEKDIYIHFSNWQKKFLESTEKYKKFIETHVVEIPDKNYDKYSNIIFELIVN